MSEVMVSMPRIEGGMSLHQDKSGAIRIGGGWRPVYERLMHRRGPLDAVQLAQHISVDSGLSHGFAALKAFENAAGILPTPNGLALREVLHACALMHAHIRHIYMRVLPDYLPPSEGLNNDSIRKTAHTPAWRSLNFAHPFSAIEKTQLFDSIHQAQLVLRVLQRILAMLGGRFPIAMCLVPGGVTTPLTAHLMLQIGTMLEQVARFVESHFEPDIQLIVTRFPALLTSGRGVKTLFSAGNKVGEANVNPALFSSGILRNGKLSALQGTPEESVAHARYQMAKQALETGVLTMPDATKLGAISWVKSPRWQGKSAESGPAARLAVAFSTDKNQSAFSWGRDLVKQMKNPIFEINTIGGRLLAILGETMVVLRHSQAQLQSLDPDRKVMVEGETFSKVSAEGVGEVESPAGAVRHWVVFERGRIVFYDIISASTWHGGAMDETGQRSPLETALNETPRNLRLDKDVRLCSQIIHSFAFSMSDAIH